MKVRQSNFELLRIILMISIPLYHLMLYSGMNNLPFSGITLASTLITSGSAIVADYAFMAMSSYFFLKSKKKFELTKVVNLVIQVLFIYFVKMVILRIVLKVPEDYHLFKGYFYKGSWWFIYVYITILCVYPFLNTFIGRLKLRQIKLICIVLGGWFTFNGITYVDHYLNDIVAFLFTYFIVAYLQAIDYKKFLMIKNSKTNMLIIYLIGYILTIICCLMTNILLIEKDSFVAIEIIRRLIGKYAIHQFIMGIAIFLLFKGISIPCNRIINGFAKNVFYVFLLHETVMACFWSKGLLVIIEERMPYDGVLSMLLWCGIYLICSFMFAILVRYFYEYTIKVLVDKVAIWIKEIAQNI